MAMDMEIDTLRGQSSNSSSNSSRALLVHLNISFIRYTEWIHDQWKVWEGVFKKE